jgi:hypothetical protein
MEGTHNHARSSSLLLVFLELTTPGQVVGVEAVLRVNYGRFIAEPRLETFTSKRKLTISPIRHGPVHSTLINLPLSVHQRMGWVDKVPRASNLYIGGSVKYLPGTMSST